MRPPFSWVGLGVIVSVGGGGVYSTTKRVTWMGVGTGTGAGFTNQNRERNPATNTNRKMGITPMREDFFLGFCSSIEVRRSCRGGRSCAIRFGLGVGRNCHSLRIVHVAGAVFGAARSGILSTEVCAAKARDVSSSVVVLSRSAGFLRSAQSVMREKLSGMLGLIEMGAGGMVSNCALRT